MKTEKKKWCDVGNHEVHALWKARTRTKPSSCKNCMARYPKEEVKSEKQKVREIEKKSLNVFFASQTLAFPRLCENCGHPLQSFSSWERRKATAHILPKSPNSGFPEVSTHPSNRVFICCDYGCFGHGQWDNGNAEDRKKMPVYAIAIERFNEFKQFINPARLNKALIYLGIEKK